MLEEIRIQNFAIIENLTLNFAADFNVITGETGAGKSIILDAMNMLLGSKADSSLVRAGADRALIEGTFVLSAEMQAELLPLLEREALRGDDDRVLVLAREVRANGRSAARINGVTVKLDILSEIGGVLVDIHGQSEHLSLLKPKQHVFLLDRYANLEALRDSVAGVFGQLRALYQELRQLLQDEAALARRADMLAYQIEEIEAVMPKPGEDDDIREALKRVTNAEKLASLSEEAYILLIEGGPDVTAAMDNLQQAAILVRRLADIDPAMAEQAEWAENLSVQAEELGQAMREYNESTEYDPLRIEELEERYEAIQRIKRKYGGTISAALVFLEDAHQELDTIEHSEERLNALRQQETQLLRALGEAAGRLSERRQAAAEQLSASIEGELSDLKMDGARFAVSIQQQADENGAFVGGARLAFDATGVDRVEFLLSANPGEPLMPLSKVASGGETSRIMLALKGVLGRVDQTPTLIFDEIDQGIGGRIGAIVGQKLWNLAEGHQVLVVTHLAQLAGFADTHFRISKGVRNGRTVSQVEVLDDKARVAELAEMLGAQTDSARQSAHDILMLARRIKEGQGV